VGLWFLHGRKRTGSSHRASQAFRGVSPILSHLTWNNKSKGTIRLSRIRYKERKDTMLIVTTIQWEKTKQKGFKVCHHRKP
jgi:hypothetical protein